MARISKKMLVMLLSFMMVVTLTPANVFATDGDAPQEGGITISDPGRPVTSEDGMITAAKTIESVEGEAGQFDITLSATVDGTVSSETTSNPAHVVLVIDRSGSMGESYGNSIAASKAAAAEFADSFLGTGSSAANMLAVVSYAGKASTDIGLTGSTGLDSVKAAINGISAAGGTNIQAGIHTAQSILTAGSAEGVQNLIVLLSDGAATYSYRLTGQREIVRGDQGLREYGPLSISCSYADSNIIGQGNSYYLRGNNITVNTTWNGHTFTDWWQYVFNGTGLEYAWNRWADNGAATRWEADQAKAAGTSIYSILLTSKMSADEKTVSTSDMKYIASGEDHFKGVDDASGIADAFRDVITEITTYPEMGTVTDPMPAYVSADSIVGYTEDGEVTMPSASNGQTLTWDLSKAAYTEEESVRTYSLTYRITVQEGETLYDAIIAANGNAVPTNGITTLTYGAGSLLELNVPTVTCALPQYDVTYAWTNAPDGATLPTGGPVGYGDNYTVNNNYVAGQQIKGQDDATYTFSGWKLNGNVVTEVDNVKGSIALTGVWTVTVPDKHSVTGSFADSTTGTVEGGSQLIPDGESSGVITFTPAEGYEITNVSVTVGENIPVNEEFTKDANGVYTYAAVDRVKADINVVATAQLKLYQVTYRWTGNVPGGITPPPSASVSHGGSYTVDTTYKAATTIEVRDSSENVTGTYSFSGWKLGDAAAPAQITGITAPVELTGIWTYKAAEAPQYAAYKIYYHYVDALGIDTTVDMTADNPKERVGATVSTAILADPAKHTDAAGVENNYILRKTDNLTEDQQSNLMIQIDISATEAQNVINVYYDIDNWHDADITEDETDKDLQTGGDGIADNEQALIRYSSGNTAYGTVAPAFEVLTYVKSDIPIAMSVSDPAAVSTDTGHQKWAANTLNGNRFYGSTATVINLNGYTTTFTGWSGSDREGQITATTPLFEGRINMIGPVRFPTIYVEGGHTYDFVAAFTRTSNGGGDNGGRSSSGGGTVTIPEVKPPLAELTEDHVGYIVGYEDGTVRPKADISRSEVATIFFRLLTDKSRTEIWSTLCNFSDVFAGSWYNNAVATLTNGQILKGYTDGTFLPDHSITRAEFAAIAARFDTSDVDTSKTYFNDVSGHWAEAEISRAAALGYIDGYSDGSFRPDQPITRAEAVTLLNRVLGRDTITEAGLITDQMVKFTDCGPDCWYYVAMSEAANSHDYVTTDGVEAWSKLQPARDWTALEKEWADASSAPAPSTDTSGTSD